MLKKKQKVLSEKQKETCEYWYKQGEKVLNERYLNTWKEMVDKIILDDIYWGMPLPNSLELVNLLNKGMSFEYVRAAIYNQDHSGASFSLVTNMVEHLCSRGKDFSDYITRLR